MRFSQLSVNDAHLIDVEWHGDERGGFARTFCTREFAEHGIEMSIAQCNISRTRRRGTVRGLHYQLAPAAEAKLLRCISGATHHVLLDMRRESVTYGQTAAVELRAESAVALYVPPLCAHGHQALTDGAELLYMTSHPHDPEHERGVRHDDPALGVAWPLPVVLVSAKDRSWPLLHAAPIAGDES
jgi:dTDP-4-dehydrorhamnose 3,5-epimerase